MNRRLVMFIWKFLSCLLLFICVMEYYILQEQYKKELQIVRHATILLVSKQDMSLRLIDYKGKELFFAPMACGKSVGNKLVKGDMKTPEGIFQVQDIQNASDWKHDFKDGKGDVENAYGLYFIRLNTPGHKGIGIHGTHDSLSIGTRATEGCIRLNNEDLIKLVSLIYPPLTVVITPSAEDEAENALLNKPKDKS